MLNRGPMEDLWRTMEDLIAQKRPQPFGTSIREASLTALVLDTNIGSGGPEKGINGPYSPKRGHKTVHPPGKSGGYT